MNCPECAKPMVFEQRVETINYQGRTAEVEVEADWCDHCQEAIFEGLALEKMEKAFLKLRAEPSS